MKLIINLSKIHVHKTTCTIPIKTESDKIASWLSDRTSETNLLQNVSEYNMYIYVFELSMSDKQFNKKKINK